MRWWGQALLALLANGAVVRGQVRSVFVHHSNDALSFTGSDRYYTAGQIIGLSWQHGAHTWLGGVTGSVFNPRFIGRSTVLPGDRPYASHLALFVAHAHSRPRSYYYHELEAGALGLTVLPEFQRFLHQAFYSRSSEPPAGWRTQVGRGGVATLQLRWLGGWHLYTDGALAVAAQAEATAGSLVNYVALGPMFSSAQLLFNGGTAPPRRVQAWFNPQVRYVLYNSTLRGPWAGYSGPYVLSHNQTVPLQYTHRLGLRVRAGRVVYSFTHELGTHEVKADRRVHVSGQLGLELGLGPRPAVMPATLPWVQPLH